MSQFATSYKIVKEKEFSNRPEKFLHKNKTETHLTLGGVYEKFHQLATNWHFVHDVLKVCDNDIQRASTMLFYDEETQKDVATFFKKEFWIPLRLDEVQSQKVADEIFLSAVHIGKRSAIKLAQEVVGAKVDGYIGNMTIKCLNNYDEQKFDKFFDLIEIENYELMIEKNERLSFYREGFIDRAVSV